MGVPALHPPGTKAISALPRKLGAKFDAIREGRQIREIQFKAGKEAT